jgi:N-acetylmuramoyl-L-alanine amidase
LFILRTVVDRIGGLAAAVLFLALVLGAVASAQDAAAPVAANAPPRLPEIADARLTTTPERARLVLDLTATTEFAVVSLAEPDRIAIDVKASSLQFVAPADVAGDGLVSDYSIEMAESGRARTLLVLSAPAQVQQAYVLEAVSEQPARLVVDLIPDTADAFAARVAADLATSQALRDAEAGAAVPSAAVAPADGTRPLVVIDPGHGGIDNGASAPNGVREKEITLAFALQLQEELVATGRFDVALTRTDDSYLTLDQRVALARANKADLFISLHADSFQQHDIRGASVYTRDERATDVLDKVLAENENKSDLVAGFAVPQMQPVVVDILVDLMRRQMRRQSFLAAQSIVAELKPSIELRRFPVRQADFFVLQAPEVPSVLVELGFLSNASDIANLQKSEWRDRAVSALARGIAAYFENLGVTDVAMP